MIDIESITVKLGEKEYEVKTAGFLRSKPWKQRLLNEVKPLFSGISESQEIEFKSPADLINLMPLAEQLFVESVDLVIDLLITYSPILETDRDYIEAHASDKQIFGAFQEVVKLADFLGLTSQLNRRFGLMQIGTS